MSRWTARSCAKPEDGVTGDASDYAEVARFMRSPEGQRTLDKFQQSLLEKVICGVTFCHLSTGVSVRLHFTDGGHLDLAILEQAFAIESLRDRYKDVLERKYYLDFPDPLKSLSRFRGPVQHTRYRRTLPEEYIFSAIDLMERCAEERHRVILDGEPVDRAELAAVLAETRED